MSNLATCFPKKGMRESSPNLPVGPKLVCVCVYYILLGTSWYKRSLHYSYNHDFTVHHPTLIESKDTAPDPSRRRPWLKTYS